VKALLIPEYGTNGGTRTFFFRLLDIHHKNNVNTGIIIPEAQADKEVLSVCKEKDFPVFAVPDRKPVFFEAYTSLLYDFYFYRGIIKRFSPDMVVVSNGTPGINLGVFLMSFPVLYIMHTVPNKTSWKTAGMKLIHRFFTSRKKSMATVSHYAAKKIHENMQVPEINIDVVYNSCPVFPDRPKQKSTPMVLTVGHVVAYKNPETWLAVAKKIVSWNSAVRFIWLGDGRLLKKMRTLVEELHLGKNIIFYGFTPDITRFYREATVYFQPSRIESHGISVLNAMAHALPCVVSNAGGLPESVQDGKTGYVCSPDDVNTFFEKIRVCLEDPVLSGRMGAAGGARAETVFNQEIQELKILDLYHEKIAGVNRND